MRCLVVAAITKPVAIQANRNRIDRGIVAAQNRTVAAWGGEKLETVVTLEYRVEQKENGLKSRFEIN
jgi:hypothetical protein